MHYQYMFTINKYLASVIFITLVLIIPTSCEFQPDDLPDSQIEPPGESGPPILISLNDRIDTIRIGWVTDFHYNIYGTNNIIRNVIVTFEKEEIHNLIENNQQTFTFTFNPASYADGNYHLNIKVFTSTGSGSIADKIGAEIYIYELDWPVHIDKTLPDAIYNYIISAKKTDKGIELTWPSFNHPNFISYQVFRHYSFVQSEPVPIVTITDPLNNEFIDSTFWEGTSCRYWVRINIPPGPFDGEYIWVYPGNLTGLKAKLNADRTIDVSWDKAKNPESFSKYYISAGHSPNGIYDSHFIEDPEQNYIKLNFGAFGSSLYIFLRFIPPGVTEPYFKHIGYAMIELYIPPMIPVHSASYYVNGRDFILLSSNYSIYRYYPPQVWVADTISDNLLSTCMLAISNNGNRFVYYSDDKFYVRNTDDFLPENEFSGPPLSSLNKTIIYYSISDNGRMLAVDNKGVSYLFDITNGKLLNQDTLIIDGYSAQKVLISKDGTKLLAKTDIIDYPIVFYDYGQNGWIESGRSDNTPYDILYSVDGSMIYVAYRNKIETRSAIDFSNIRSFDVLEGYFQSADLKNGRFLWNRVGSEDYIFGDMNTGLTLRSMNLRYEGTCTLFDNYIITSTGYQLTIAEFL